MIAYWIDLLNHAIGGDMKRAQGKDERNIVKEYPSIVFQESTWTEHSNRNLKSQVSYRSGVYR